MNRTDLLDPWLGREPVGRVPYLAWGTSLLALKILLDVCLSVAFGQTWNPLMYFTVPFLEGFTIPDMEWDWANINRMLWLGSMALLTLPFLFAGLFLTERRLKSAGFPWFLMALFFLPGINFPFFWLLCVVPPSPETQMGIDEADEDGEQPSTSFDWLYGSRTWSALAGVLVAGLMATGAVAFSANVFEAYPPGLFFAVPFAMGVCASLFHSTRQWRSLNECMKTGALAAVMAYLCAGVLMMIFYLEGLICLIMAALIALPGLAFGAMVGGALVFAIQRHPMPARTSVLVAIALFAAVLGQIGAESALLPESPRLYAATTVVEVDAPPETVWRHVVTFSELDPPQELMFIAGVAYPIRAEIKGTGVGAVRHCVFSTGSFVEPITVWKAPRELSFDVAAQPDPVKEISPWPHVHPTHLDMAFRSRRGQFLLTPLPGGGTRLEGTTWYTLDIWPQWYWKLATDFIVHRIHLRVLTHIERRAEAEAQGVEPLADPKYLIP